MVLEVPAPAGGVITEIRAASGDTVTSEQVLAILDTEASVEVPIRCGDPEEVRAAGGDGERQEPRSVTMTR